MISLFQYVLFENTLKPGLKIKLVTTVERWGKEDDVAWPARASAAIETSRLRLPLWEDCSRAAQQRWYPKSLEKL
jgi:hypothetical protein